MPTSNRATQQQLQELHTQMVQIFVAWLEAEPDKLKLRPAHLEIMRKFLADNGIKKDLPKALDQKTTLEELGSLSIPFLPIISQVNGGQTSET